MNVRENLPVRRRNPTNEPTGRNWSDHKPDLKEDFNDCCAYCGSFDGFRHTYFEVDHFVPKSFFEINGEITYCQYDNLVYSCKFCNNYKGSKWPSQSEKVYAVDDKGFVDPCSEEYENHLYRLSDGSIGWRTELGKWMVTKAFKFVERSTSIALLWEFRKCKVAMDKLKVLLEEHDEGSEDYLNILNELLQLGYSYYYYHGELIDYYDSL